MLILVGGLLVFLVVQAVYDGILVARLRRRVERRTRQTANAAARAARAERVAARIAVLNEAQFQQIVTLKRAILKHKRECQGKYGGPVDAALWRTVDG